MRAAILGHNLSINVTATVFSQTHSSIRQWGLDRREKEREGEKRPPNWSSLEMDHLAGFGGLPSRWRPAWRLRPRFRTHLMPLDRRFAYLANRCTGAGHYLSLFPLPFRANRWRCGAKKTFLEALLLNHRYGPERRNPGSAVNRQGRVHRDVIIQTRPPMQNNKALACCFASFE